MLTVPVVKYSFYMYSCILQLLKKKIFSFSDFNEMIKYYSQ